MATVITLTISCPDADAPDLLAALRLEYATNGVPVPTQAQLKAAAENELRQKWKAMVVAYRRNQTVIAEPVLS